MRLLAEEGDVRGRDDEHVAECYCLAIRQAARHVTQFYDHVLAPTGLRGTQFSILSRLARLGPLTINELAGRLVMDRTTLGRNIRPLQREGLITVVTGRTDRRAKELHLTEGGTARLQAALQRWKEAQARFEEAFGAEHSADIRVLMRTIAAADLETAVPRA
jgi:DNA-binding MarR family transcriptional regulator